MRVGGAASRCGPTPGVITINLFVLTSLTYSQKFHDFMTFNTAISPNDTHHVNDNVEFTLSIQMHQQQRYY